MKLKIFKFSDPNLWAQWTFSWPGDILGCQECGVHWRNMEKPSWKACRLSQHWPTNPIPWIVSVQLHRLRLKIILKCKLGDIRVGIMQSRGCLRPGIQVVLCSWLNGSNVRSVYWIWMTPNNGRYPTFVPIRKQRFTSLPYHTTCDARSLKPTCVYICLKLTFYHLVI